MATKKSSKQDNHNLQFTKEKPKYLIKEEIAKEYLSKLKKEWDKFSVGMRVYRMVDVHVENTVFCKKGVKCGVIYSKIVNPGGLCQLLVLWDGDKVPIPEQAPLLKEEW